MINTAIKMPRGTKPEGNCFLFGTTQEYDCYMVSRKPDKEEYWAFDRSLDNTKYIIAESDFKFSHRQIAFSNKLGFPKEQK